jgi:mersacidin/lichenicidin family type 2 lantibiotic
LTHVKVVENADNCVHITMPAPPSGSNELSDEELSNAAGGVSPNHASAMNNSAKVEQCFNCGEF